MGRKPKLVLINKRLQRVLFFYYSCVLQSVQMSKNDDVRWMNVYLIASSIPLYRGCWKLRPALRLKTICPPSMPHVLRMILFFCLAMINVFCLKIVIWTVILCISTVTCMYLLLFGTNQIQCRYSPDTYELIAAPGEIEGVSLQLRTLPCRSDQS